MCTGRLPVMQRPQLWVQPNWQRVCLTVLFVLQYLTWCTLSGAGPHGRARPGDELPDSCKLYVGNLSQACLSGAISFWYRRHCVTLQLPCLYWTLAICPSSTPLAGSQ